MNLPQQKPQTRHFRTWKLVAWAAGAIIIVLGMIGAVMLWLGSQINQSEFTASTEVRQVIIGNDVLDIPANYIRFARQRKAAVQDRIEVVLLMPTGNGYSSENAEKFRDTSAQNNLVFVSFLKRKMAEDMSGRLDLIYSKLFEGPTQSGPVALTLYNFKRGVGYDDEFLAVHYGEDFTWVARCQKKAENISPTCLRDINIGASLSARFRFPVAKLSNWREIEALVRLKVSEFLLKT